MATEYILGIDYGAQRVGVALMHSVARLPHPLTTLVNDQALFANIVDIIRVERVGKVIVGVPRNMDGTESAQSAECRTFAAELASQTDVPIETVDETLSSVEAEQRLKAQKSTGHGVDAEAAAIILERYEETQAVHENV
jgi:putative Holliday junction resolvase